MSTEGGRTLYLVSVKEKLVKGELSKGSNWDQSRELLIEDRVMDAKRETNLRENGYSVRENGVAPS